MICEVDDLPVYYESFGAGRPIVFLPGWATPTARTGRCTSRSSPTTPGWQRIYLDPPGTGRTPSRPWITDQDGILAVLQRVADEVTAGRDFAIAGTSDARIATSTAASTNPRRAG